METGIDLAKFAAETGQPLAVVVKEMLSFNHFFGSAGRKRDWKTAWLTKHGRRCRLCGKHMKKMDDLVLDHVRTMKVAAEDALSGKMRLAESYNTLWAEKNMRVVHSACNYGRNGKRAPKVRPR